MRAAEPRTSSSWLAAVGLAVGASIALGLFAFRHVPYRNELWWQVSLTGDVPRFLRAALASVLVVLAFSVVWLLRPTRIVPLWPGKYELDIAQRIAGGFPIPMHTWHCWAISSCCSIPSETVYHVWCAGRKLNCNG